MLAQHPREGGHQQHLAAGVLRLWRGGDPFPVDLRRWGQWMLSVGLWRSFRPDSLGMQRAHVHAVPNTSGRSGIRVPEGRKRRGALGGRRNAPPLESRSHPSWPGVAHTCANVGDCQCALLTRVYTRLVRADAAEQPTPEGNDDQIDTTRTRAAELPANYRGQIVLTQQRICDKRGIGVTIAAKATDAPDRPSTLVWHRPAASATSSRRLPRSTATRTETRTAPRPLTQSRRPSTEYARFFVEVVPRRANEES